MLEQSGEHSRQSQLTHDPRHMYCTVPDGGADFRSPMVGTPGGCGSKVSEPSPLPLFVPCLGPFEEQVAVAHQ